MYSISAPDPLTHEEQYPAALEQVTVLIPAYEPDERLITLIHHLLEEPHVSILIVNDGSGEDYQGIFDTAEQLGCTVLTHAANRGKGCALKTGFQYLLDNRSQTSIVCADCDGQHTPLDIRRIASYVQQHPHELVLGSRHFTGKVPLRSRFGNSLTRSIYRFTTGVHLQDTQTGLRGYSTEMLEWLCQLPGERFEYEINMLLAAPSAGYVLHEVQIDTVYLENNKSSHFRPFTDSIEIYIPILLFSASSILSGLLDFILFFWLHWATSSLVVGVVGARVCSSIFNYSLNRNYVFTKGRHTEIYYSLPRYFALVLLIMLLNYSLIYVLNEHVGIPLFFAKVLTECVLFLFSFWSQRKFVY